MSKPADRKNKSVDAATAEPVKIGAMIVDAAPNQVMTTDVSAAEPQIRIDSNVTRRIRQHARAHLKTEVCGVLIGESSDGIIDVRASIEALNAAQAGTHVTFTQDAWEEIYKVKDDLYPDARIVGWYHSHPGFGIFLSEHDLFIQENFFSSPGQVAWVYDPHSDDEGCFGWVAGKVARLTSIATLYQSGDPIEHATKGHDSNSAHDDENSEESEDSPQSRPARSTNVPMWVTISRMAFTHLTVLLAGFAAAFFLFPRIVALLPDPASGSVMVVDYHALRAFLDGKGAAPKPLDVFDMPASIPGNALPGASSTLPSTVPNPTPSATPAPASPRSPSPQPTPASSTIPQPTPSGGHK